MSCFAKVIEHLSLSNHWTGEPELAWLHSLLTVADAWNPGSDASTNPFTATIAHLESVVNPNTLARVRQLLSTGEERYAASH